MFSETHSDSQRADRILASIRREESRPGRGLLKIFFGMAPGVGKTYAMLEAAIQAAGKGVQVMIGVAESHGREDTMRLIGRLPRLPMKKMAYRGVQMEEFDLEEALRVKPQLILVDELAHTNVPGMRHRKRYQDVEDLLAAGIDVYTTLNVQHLESRSDTVHDITAAPVQETVPDSVLAEADCIQLVDITPEQLRTRLQEGKVYSAPQASAALNHFFKESNLTALRELALRIMAEKVDHELTEVRTISGDRSIWRSGERLMVAVGPSPFSARLVRWTRRMAYALNAPWIALSVDTGVPLSPEQQQRLDANLELARRLGAEVIVMPGSDLAETLLRMAFLRNVSQIVVGKPQEAYLWGLVRPMSLVDKLVKGSDQIDIYVVPAAPGPVRNRWKSWHRETEKYGRDYWLAAGGAGAAAVSRQVRRGGGGRYGNRPVDFRVYRLFRSRLPVSGGSSGPGLFHPFPLGHADGRCAERPAVEPAVHSPGDDVQDRTAGGCPDVPFLLSGGSLHGAAHFPPEGPRAGGAGTGKKDECPVPVFAGHWVRLGRAFPDFRRRRADQPDHGGAPGGHDAGRQRPQAEALGIRGGFFHG